ncbi:dihydrofolate reductase family protein [Streptomyces sp. NPDC023327]
MRQFIDAGLLDELQIHLVPLVLGSGVRLFDGVSPYRA